MKYEAQCIPVLREVETLEDGRQTNDLHLLVSAT